MIKKDSIIELEVFADGTSKPAIDNQSMVIIDKYDHFEIGIINLIKSSNTVEIFCLCNVLDINKNASNFLLRTFPRKKEKESVYFLKNEAVKTIFQDYTFKELPSSTSEFKTEIILIDSGMLEYGLINGNYFQKKSDLKNYDYIKAIFYSIIDALDEEIFEKENQIILKVPEKLNSLIEPLLHQASNDIQNRSL